MALTINTNVSAMFAHNELQQTDNALSSSIQKLSSGSQINSAADNPAGLAISENLTAQMNGLGQAVNNANDAINVLKTADGGLSQIDSLIQQIRTIAVQAANVGANDTVSTQADQTQITQALSALDRIATQTAFGQRTLLDGSGSMSATNLDPTLISGANLASSGSPLVAGYADIDVTTAAGKATQTMATGGLTVASTLAAGTITINGSSITIGAGETVQAALDAMNGKTTDTGVIATLSGGKLKLDQTNFGSNNIIAYAESVANFNAGATSLASGTDAVATVTQGVTVTNFNVGKGNVLQDAAGDAITLNGAGSTGSVSNALYVNGSALVFQVGAMSGQTAQASIGSAKSADLGNATVGYLSAIDVTSSAGAQTAIQICDAALDQVSTSRASLGATQQGLQDTVSSLGIAKENIASSNSAIADTDMASQMTNFTQQQILEQAGISMLAQANSSPQYILKLVVSQRIIDLKFEVDDLPLSPPSSRMMED